MLKNAAAAIDEDGEIRIRTSVSEDYAVVRISDNGTGIAPERLERVFDFGFQRSGATVKMGFGLTTSYRILQEHDGDIRIDSALGRGTAVTVLLPARASAAS